MLSLQAQSDLSEMANLRRRYRCTRAGTGKGCSVDEINPARALTEAWLALGGDMNKIRVEPAAIGAVS